MVKKLKICLFVSTESTNVTVKPTDGRTDGRTTAYAALMLSIARKKKPSIVVVGSLLQLLMSWAWCDWSALDQLNWLTNHSPSVLWHCWLGHLTREIVPEMTYNVSSGTLNPAIRILIVVGWNVSSIHEMQVVQLYKYKYMDKYKVPSTGSPKLYLSCAGSP